MPTIQERLEAAVAENATLKRDCQRLTKRLNKAEKRINVVSPPAYSGPKHLDEATGDAFFQKVFKDPHARCTNRRDLEPGVLSMTSMCTVEQNGKTIEVVVKIPSENDGSRAFAVQANAYARELCVYTTLKNDLDAIGFETADFHYADSDSTDGNSTCEWNVLVIGAFKPDTWAVCDQVIGMGYNEWELAVRDLAKLHARFYKDDKALDAKWLTPEPGTHSILTFWQPFHQAFPDAYPALKGIWASGSSNPMTKGMCYFAPDLNGPHLTGPANEKAGGTMYDLGPIVEVYDFLSKPEVCMPMMEAMYAIISSRPRTINFGDFRGDNMFRSLDGKSMAFIDFQLFSSGPPGYDFNQPLGSFDETVMGRHEEFVAAYYEALNAAPNGAELAAAYPKEHFYEDMRIAAIQFTVGIFALGLGTFSQPTSDRMSGLWVYAISRYMIAMDMIGCVAFVKELAAKQGIPYP